MTQVIDTARKRLAEIEIEAEQIKTFIQMYERLATFESATSPPQTEESVAITVLRGTNISSSPPAQIVESSKDLMREKQRPLTRSELVKLLTLRGLKIGGTDKSKNLGTVIWRSGDFVNVSGAGYWPKAMGPWPTNAPNDTQEERRRDV